MLFPLSRQECQVAAYMRRIKQGPRRAKQVCKLAAAVRWRNYYLSRGKPVPRKLTRIIEKYNPSLLGERVSEPAA